MYKKATRSQSLTNFNNSQKLSKGIFKVAVNKFNASSKNLVEKLSKTSTETPKTSISNSVSQLISPSPNHRNLQNKSQIPHSPLINTGNIFVFGDNKSSKGPNQFICSNDNRSQFNKRSESLNKKASISSNIYDESEILKDTPKIKKVSVSSTDIIKTINEDKKSQIRKESERNIGISKSNHNLSTSNSSTAESNQSYIIKDNKKIGNEKLKNIDSHQNFHITNSKHIKNESLESLLSHNYKDNEKKNFDEKQFLNSSNYEESKSKKSEAPFLSSYQVKSDQEIFSDQNKRINESYKNRSSINEQSSSNCSSCKSVLSTNNTLFKTPKCEAHQYCKSCISNKNYSKSCTHCDNYLKSILRQYKPNMLICFLCISFPDSRNLGCKIHSYCNKCFNFLIYNDFPHIKKVNECEDCKNFIKSKKKCETPRIPNEIKNTQEKKIILGFNKTDSWTNFNPDSARNKVAQQSENSIFAMSEKKNLNREARKSIEVVAKRKNAMATTPCSSVRSFRENIKCCICGVTENIKGFLCNHNVCTYCLVGSCCKNIIQFFTIYQLDQEYAHNIFSYSCPKSDCDKRICVPTQYVISKLISYLSDPITYEFFKYFSSLADPKRIEKWIPYFDGLGSHSFY